MAYCTQSDIEKLIPTQELAELTTESGSTPDAAVVTEAIAKADAEIDSYLGSIFSLPISVAPARLKGLSEDISIYYLYIRRSTVPEARKKAYDDAIAFLRLAVEGKVVITDSTGSVASNLGISFYSSDSIFDRDNMTGW